MLAVARTLSILAVLLTVLFIDVILVHLLPLGFHGSGIVVDLTFWPAIMSALLALVIVVRRARSGERAGFALIAVPAAICLLVIAVLVLPDIVGEVVMWWGRSRA